MTYLFCWDQSLDDGTYGKDGSAAIIAESLFAARELLDREWAAFRETLSPEAWSWPDGLCFYGLRYPGWAAWGVVQAVQATPPDRTVPLHASVREIVVLLCDGYNG